MMPWRACTCAGMLHTMPAMHSMLADTCPSPRVLGAAGRQSTVSPFFSRTRAHAGAVAGRRAGAARRCGARVLTRDQQHAACGCSRAPHAAAICIALMHSLDASSEEAILDCVCVV